MTQRLWISACNSFLFNSSVKWRRCYITGAGFSRFRQIIRLLKTFCVCVCVFSCSVAVQTESSSTDSEAHVWPAPWQRSPAVSQTNIPSKIKPQTQQSALTSGLRLFILPELLTDLWFSPSSTSTSAWHPQTARSPERYRSKTERRFRHWFSTHTQSE